MAVSRLSCGLKGPRVGGQVISATFGQRLVLRSCCCNCQRFAIQRGQACVYIWGVFWGPSQQKIVVFFFFAESEPGAS